MTENLELNRMRWRCRRGLLELDLLLGPFFEAMYLTLDADQQLNFPALAGTGGPRFA